MGVYKHSHPRYSSVNNNDERKEHTMSRSGLPSTIFLEFKDVETDQPRVVGTDAIMHVDGRWSRDTAASHAYEKAAEMRKRQPSLALVGYSKPGDFSGKVHKL